MKRTPYDHLALVPWIAAETVAGQPYTGIEYKYGGSFVAKTELLRQAMTPEMVREFADAADQWCRDAYAAKAEWFEKIARSQSNRGNRGRDQLYVWLSHWLAAYLADPTEFMARHRHNVITTARAHA